MTVRELLNSIGDYLNIDLMEQLEGYCIENGLDDTVCIVDDGMQTRHWKISMVAGKNLDREVKPAKVEMRDDVISGPEGNYVRKIPYQIEPPEYKTEHILGIFTTQEEEK